MFVVNVAGDFNYFDDSCDHTVSAECQLLAYNHGRSLIIGTVIVSHCNKLSVCSKSECKTIVVLVNDNNT